MRRIGPGAASINLGAAVTLANLPLLDLPMGKRRLGPAGLCALMQLPGSLEIISHSLQQTRWLDGSIVEC